MSKILRDIEDGLWNGIDWIVRHWPSMTACVVAGLIGFAPFVILALTGDHCG